MKTKSTTILCVRRDDKVVMAGDGQVTLGNTVMKAGAQKVRKIYKDSVITGFAGASADAMALLDRFEAKLEEYKGNLSRAAVELSRDWRTDKVLRRLEALMVVCDKEDTYLISGTGDLFKPDDGVIAVGSGGPYALAAARALLEHTKMDAKSIALEAMKIASNICIYTNSNITLEELN
ncbi:MAG: ATP-dependent protease subunit HslV [Acidobacteria bacterium]|nr:ATP-dependent protease subunit HslV [Acidobacteriota bacterium]